MALSGCATFFHVSSQGLESKVVFTRSAGVLGDFARSLLVSVSGTRKLEEVRVENE